MPQVYWVDAFADKWGAGNPAAVVPLDAAFLPDATMQRVAFENGLSETAFIVPIEMGEAESPTADRSYRIRWFTPEAEVDLCGHATLAAAFVVYHLLNFSIGSVCFHSRSGPLLVTRSPDGSAATASAVAPPVWLTMDFPSRPPIAVAAADVPPALYSGLRISQSLPLFVGRARDFLVELPTPEDVAAVNPDFSALSGVDALCVIVTSRGPALRGDSSLIGSAAAPHVVSRVFCPGCGVPEDPVTGSAHCTIVPHFYPALRTTAAKEASSLSAAHPESNECIYARQASARGGNLVCTLETNAQGEDRVKISGSAVLYMTGELHLH